MQNGYDANDSAVVSAFVGNMSNSLLQKVLDKATTAEAQTGIITNKWISPATLKAASLLLSGGTMSGPIDMGNNKITNLSDPTADSDAVNKKYVDEQTEFKILGSKEVTFGTDDPNVPILSFDDLISGVQDKSRPLYIYVEANLVFRTSSGPRHSSINIAYSIDEIAVSLIDIRTNYSEEKDNLVISDSALVPIRIFSRYESGNKITMMSILGYNSAFDENNQNIRLYKDSFMTFKSGTIKVKLYQG